VSNGPIRGRFRPGIILFDRHPLEGLWGNPKELGVKLKKLLAPFLWTEEDTALRLRNRRS
jgi:hypothetical protein